MRDLFYNSKGFNTAAISFISNNKTHTVYFQLNDNPIQHCWQEMHINNKDIETQPMENIGIHLLSRKLKEHLKKVNILDYTEFNQESLNTIHNLFVQRKEENPDTWQMINLLVHKIEAAIDDPYVEYNSSIHFNKSKESFVDIKEEDKLWLVTDFKWGDLLLGYGTLGKDYLEIFECNDDFTDLNVQSTINSEGIIFFHVENPLHKHSEKFFYPWAKEKSVSLDNLNDLSLGRYILGQIIITEELINFHPNVSDWYVPNHKCKLDWNNKIVGSDTKVTNIEFFDSDLYYHSIKEHSHTGILF